MSRLIVVLPAYNEEHTLPPLLARFRRLFKQLPAEADPIVIVVNDGSSDRTAEMARRAARKMPLRLVEHDGNKGLGQAIKTGIRAGLEEVRGDRDVIVGMDADNTHPPKYVVPMLKEIEAGADIVIASRYRQGSRQVGVPLKRMAMSYGALVLFKLCLNVSGTRDYTCGFRAYRAGLLQKAMEVYGDEIITRNGFACTDQLLVNLVCLGDVKVREIPFVLRYDRKEGESKLDLGVTVVETFKLLLDGRRKLRAARRRKPACG